MREMRSVGGHVRALVVFDRSGVPSSSSAETRPTIGTADIGATFAAPTGCTTGI
jgi:hypothetical protein